MQCGSPARPPPEVPAPGRWTPTTSQPAPSVPGCTDLSRRSRQRTRGSYRDRSPASLREGVCSPAPGPAGHRSARRSREPLGDWRYWRKGTRPSLPGSPAVSGSVPARSAWDRAAGCPGLPSSSRGGTGFRLTGRAPRSPVLPEEDDSLEDGKGPHDDHQGETEGLVEVARPGKAEGEIPERAEFVDGPFPPREGILRAAGSGLRRSGQRRQAPLPRYRTSGRTSKCRSSGTVPG